MADVAETRTKLMKLVEEINRVNGHEKIQYGEQRIRKERMYVRVVGRSRESLRIRPTNKGWNVGLMGESLHNRMYEYMSQLTGRKHDMWGFPDKESMPIWKVDNFELVEKAVRWYSKT